MKEMNQRVGFEGLRSKNRRKERVLLDFEFQRERKSVCVVCCYKC